MGMSTHIDNRDEMHKRTSEDLRMHKLLLGNPKVVVIDTGDPETMKRAAVKVGTTLGISFKEAQEKIRQVISAFPKMTDRAEEARKASEELRRQVVMRTDLELIQYKPTYNPYRVLPHPHKPEKGSLRKQFGGSGDRLDRRFKK